MTTVPEAYYEFVMHYAPYFYVIPTLLTVDASVGQKNVTVSDGTKFRAGFPVEVKDEAHAEWNEVDKPKSFGNLSESFFAFVSSTSTSIKSSGQAIKSFFCL